MLNVGGVIIATRFFFSIKISIISVLLQDLWFLKCLFVLFLIVYVLHHIKNTTLKILFIIFAVVTTTLYSVYRLNDMLIPFLFGYFFSNKMDMIMRYKLKTLICCITVFTLLGSIYINPELFKPAIFYFPFIVKRLAVIIIAISASIGVIQLSYLFQGKMPLMFNIVGRETLGIYLVQSVLLEIIVARYVSFDNCLPILSYGLLFPGVVFIIIISSVFIIKCLRRNTTCRFLLLGETKR